MALSNFGGMAEFVISSGKTFISYVRVTHLIRVRRVAENRRRKREKHTERSWWRSSSFLATIVGSAFLVAKIRQLEIAVFFRGDFC